MKKIHLRGVSEALCESEMKDVRGGEGFDTLQESGGRLVDGGGNNFGEAAKPCPEPEYRACNGPHGTPTGGGICCLVPCYGWTHDYGYAILTGLSMCP
jgi:hypothetical protein